MNRQIENFLIEHYQKSTKVAGKIVKIETDLCWVDVGLDEFISVSLKFLSAYERDRLTVGKTREFWVLKDYSDRECDRYYLDLAVLTIAKVDSRIKQLIQEDVTIYSLVVRASSYGISVEIESRIFPISNLHYLSAKDIFKIGGVMDMDDRHKNHHDRPDNH